MINRKDSRIFSILDIVKWYLDGELITSPKYQRNLVWDDNAKSYLIDSILRGYPIPPIFLAINLDLKRRKNIREIIDGQQRTRTIIDFYSDKFSIKKSHNEEFGNLTFSELPEEIQKSFLSYNLFVDIIQENDDAKIYDMFARLNTNVAALNAQEIRNAKYWGNFKVLAYDISNDFREFFMVYNTFRQKQLSRMCDVEFVSGIMINILQGNLSSSKTIIDNGYKTYDNKNLDSDFKNKLIITLDHVKEIYENFEKQKSNFFTKSYFYDLYLLIYFSIFGTDIADINISENFIQLLENMDSHLLIDALDNLDEEIYYLTNKKVYKEDKSAIENIEDKVQYIKDHTTHSTNHAVRISRINFLSKYIDDYYEKNRIY